MRDSWRRNLIIILLVASAFFFGVNYALFADVRFTLNLVTLQLAFLPISVILLTFVLAAAIARREKATRLEKLNTIIGIFFSEVGTPLLRMLVCFDRDREELARNLDLTSHWHDKEFAAARELLTHYGYHVVMDKQELPALRVFLDEKRSFLIGLMQNPNLLEHESFTELLRALFHLTDELAYRRNVTILPDTDYAHLCIDLRRAYTALLPQWLNYMQYLRKTYPYYYSLAARVNPLNPNATPEVLEG